MRKNNLAFIDIETTGLNVEKHEIIEIGCVLASPELKIIEEFELKIKPERILDADPVSLKINHYDPEKWNEAVTLKEALTILVHKTQDAIMVGQNVGYVDSVFLEQAFAKADIKNKMHYHKLDTVSMAWAKLQNEKKIRNFSLHEMCKYFGIDNARAHTALSDARATYELYKRLMAI